MTHDTRGPRRGVLVVDSSKDWCGWPAGRWGVLLLVSSVAGVEGVGFIMFYLVSYVLSWLVGGVLCLLWPDRGFAMNCLQAHLVCGVGFFGLFNFVGHCFFSERVAKSIGWVSNGFQKEIGVISLGIGVSGVYSGLVDGGRGCLPLVIVLVFFLVGAGVNHIREVLKEGNYKVGNVLIILPDFLIPLTLLALLFLVR